MVGIVQAVLTRKINPWLGNEKSIYTGLFLYSLGLTLFAFATESWMMFVFLIPYCLGGIAGRLCSPLCRAMLHGMNKVLCKAH
jgi:DHA1 family tetracycline resistance protein-like MFS transporter